MKPMNTKKLTILVSLLMVMALGSLAYATDQTPPACKQGKGYGYHHGADEHHGKGNGMKCMSTLSQDEVKKLMAAREAFFKGTQTLRLDIKSKRLAVKSEIIKSTPDADKAKTLQKELSALEAQLDQKHIAHLLEMKKIAPNVGMKCLSAGGERMGAGKGCMGKGKGKGKAANNCPKMWQ